MGSSPSTPKSFGLAVAIVVGGIVVALAMFISQPAQRALPSQLSAAALRAVSESDRVEVAVEANDPSLGAVDAPVTIILFSDFECPYCADWHRTVLPELKRSFIDPGTARLVYKDFPLVNQHSHAQVAAEAGQCAHEQGKFWEYAERLTQENVALEEDFLLTAAHEVELHRNDLAACLKEHTHAATVTANVQAGIKAGVTGTPSFVINGEFFEGAQPLAVLSAAIAAANPTR